jgi:uncharacterized membrane protein YbhN (UPF0104 family)
VGIWILTIVLGVSAVGSLCMTFLAAKDGDRSGLWFFGSFGVLFGTLLLVFGIKTMAKRAEFFKTIGEKISGKPEPQTGFVPHWFLMGAIILTVMVIVISILIMVIR